MTLDQAVVAYAEKLQLKELRVWGNGVVGTTNPAKERSAPHAALLRALGAPAPTDAEMEEARLAVIAAADRERER